MTRKVGIKRKTDTTVKKTTSQDRRDNSSTNKRDISQPKSNRSPPRFGAPCAQVRVCHGGNTPIGNNSDSDEEEEYDTPPETMDSDNPNVPEKYAHNLKRIHKLLTPAHDTSISPD